MELFSISHKPSRIIMMIKIIKLPDFSQDLYNISRDKHRREREIYIYIYILLIYTFTLLCQPGPRQCGSDLHCIGAILMITTCQSLVLFCALVLQLYLQSSRVRTRAAVATI